MLFIMTLYNFTNYPPNHLHYESSNLLYTTTVEVRTLYHAFVQRFESSDWWASQGRRYVGSRFFVDLFLGVYLSCTSILIVTKHFIGEVQGPKYIVVATGDRSRNFPDTTPERIKEPCFSWMTRAAVREACRVAGRLGAGNTRLTRDSGRDKR